MKRRLLIMLPYVQGNDGRTLWAVYSEQQVIESGKEGGNG